MHTCTHAHMHTYTHTHIHTYTHTHTPQTSDLPIAEAMIENSYIGHSNLCWDYTIHQLARLVNLPPLFLAFLSTRQLIEVFFSGQWIPIFPSIFLFSFFVFYTNTTNLQHMLITRHVFVARAAHNCTKMYTELVYKLPCLPTQHSRIAFCI